MRIYYPASKWSWRYLLNFFKWASFQHESTNTKKACNANFWIIKIINYLFIMYDLIKNLLLKEDISIQWSFLMLNYWFLLSHLCSRRLEKWQHFSTFIFECHLTPNFGFTRFMAKGDFCCFFNPFSRNTDDLYLIVNETRV